MFSFLQNQTTLAAQKYLFSKIQNQKIPLSFLNAARPSQNHHLLFPPYKKNKRSPRFTKNAPLFKIFAYSIFPLNFLNSLFLPIPFPHKNKKRINPFGFILFVSLILESVYKFQISFWGS
jgi:hypothetical protein